jgi:ribonucleoside-triphosphate reductase
MFFKVSWDEDFDTLMMHLWSKYGKELFTLDGIGEQMDLNKFAKNFFNSGQTTADVSVDANANVCGKTSIEYNFEMAKPLSRYNSYFLLWKELKKNYGLQVANNIVERQLTGDIYINDFSDIARPYCFNYSTYDIFCNGLEGVSKRIKVTHPKSLSTFLRQVEQFMVVAANSTLGATGFADLLIVASKYVDEIFRTGKDGHYGISDVYEYVKEKLTEFIYTVNWEFRGNQCVTEDTDVLTPTGFKNYKTLKVGDDIYTWKDGKLNINKVQCVNVSDYDGEMHEYKGRDICQVVTPNHRVLYKTGSNPFRIDESSNIVGKKGPFYIPIALENTNEDYPISDEDLDAVVFFLTDGSIKDGGVVRNDVLMWCKAESRYGIEHFTGIMERKGFSLYHAEKISPAFGSKMHIYRLSTEDSAYYLRLMDNTRKRLPDWMFKLSKRQAQRVIALWSKTDGHGGPDKKIKLQCDTVEIADGIQHVAMLAGYGSRQHELLIGKNKVPTRYVRIYGRKIKAALTATKVYYNGKVWCPTTEDGIVIFRKDGRIFISGNSPFTNVSLFDDTFLDSLCPDYSANKGTVKLLQRIYVEIMNEEMRRTPLTFPVTTACFCIDDNKEIADKAFLKFIAEADKEFGFINMYNGSTSTLSSCCRLRSNKDNEYFNSFGAGSSKIGSLGVVTANLPRAAYKAKGDYSAFISEVKELFTTARRINACKRKIVGKRIAHKAAPLYTHGYMDLTKQYSTFGVVGINEAVQLLGKDILTEEGQAIVLDLLNNINKWIEEAEKKEKAPHNVEQVPAESSAVKLAKKDAYMGYDIGVPLYSNQFIPLTTKADMFDRLRLQGMFDAQLSGGAIAHINVGEPIEDTDTMVALMEYAAKAGVVYWAINYRLNCCKQKHTWVGTEICPTCGQHWDSQITRVVGFFTTVKNWNPTRREHDWPNRQFYRAKEMEVSENA